MLEQKLFLAIALQVPQTEQLKKIQSLASDLRLVNPDNMHMTLFYIGMCNELQKTHIIDAMNAQIWPTFSVTLNTLEHWKKPKIVCITGKALEVNLLKIVAAIENICTRIGFSKAPHIFNPHITLLRKANALPQTLKNKDVVVPLTLCPDAIYLYHSHSGPEGVIYDKIHSWKLT